MDKEQTSAEKKHYSAFSIIGMFYSVYVLLVLFSVSLCRIFNSNLINISSEGVLKDLKLSESFFGAIIGPISSAATIIAGIALGRASDIFSRKWTLLFCVIIFTAFQILTGFSKNYWHLMFYKIGSAFGMGGLNPIQFSLITDYFLPSRRALAFGIANTSLIFGLGVSYLFGGLLTETSSNWRSIFFISSIPGAIVCVIVFLTVQEPKRGALDENNDVKKPPQFSTIIFYIIKRPSLIILSLSGAVGFAGANAINTFNPIFYQRVHQMTPQELSRWLSWISPIAGLSGSLMSALICTIVQKYTDKGYAIIAIFAVVANAPFQFASLLVENQYLSLLLYLPATFFQFLILVPMNLIMVQVIPVSGRGIAVSLFGVFITGIGSLGPLTVGSLTTLNFPIFDSALNPMAIRWALLVFHTTTRFIIFFGFLIVIFLLPYDIAALKKYYEENNETIINEEIKDDEEKKYLIEENEKKMTINQNQNIN
eukprot:gene2456-3166_t